MEQEVEQMKNDVQLMDLLKTELEGRKKEIEAMKGDVRERGACEA